MVASHVSVILYHVKIIFGTSSKETETNCLGVYRIIKNAKTLVLLNTKILWEWEPTIFLLDPCK